LKVSHIEGVLDGRKTGTVYPDRDDRNKQLFEYLLIVRGRSGMAADLHP